MQQGRDPETDSVGRASNRPRSVRHVIHVACITACLAALCGCESDEWAGAPPTADRAMFESQVYPVLMRDCSFNNTCHGDPNRYFQVFGPGRQRIDPALDLDMDTMMTATPLEIDTTYRRAVSMLITHGDIETAPLLVKPLEKSKGGAGHKGVDDFGRNVYPSKDVAGYQTLLQWAKTATYSGSAVPPVTSMPTAGSPVPMAGSTGG